MVTNHSFAPFQSAFPAVIGCMPCPAASCIRDSRSLRLLGWVQPYFWNVAGLL